eukprot:98667_1
MYLISSSSLKTWLHMGNKSSKNNKKRKQIEECQLEEYQTSSYWSKYHDDELQKYLQKYKLNAIKKIIVEYICYGKSNYNTYIHFSVTPLNDQYLIPTDYFKHEVQIVIMGNSAVGKTSITNRFIANIWNQNIIPPMFNRKEIALNVNQNVYDKYEACSKNYHSVHSYNKKIGYANLDVEDVRGWGNECFRSMEKDLFILGSIFFFVFNVMDNETFSVMKDKYSRLQSVRDDKMLGVAYVMILVGNKCDLRDDETYQNRFTPVNMDTVREFTKKHKIAYIETSAKLNKNICLLFRQSLYEYWIKCVHLNMNHH